MSSLPLDGLVETSFGGDLVPAGEDRLFRGVEHRDPDRFVAEFRGFVVAGPLRRDEIGLDLTDSQSQRGGLLVGTTLGPDRVERGEPDERLRDLADGAQLLGEGGGPAIHLGGVGLRKHDPRSCQAMLERVLPRAFLAFGRFRTGAALGVLAVRLNPSFGGLHDHRSFRGSS